MKLQTFFTPPRFQLLSLRALAPHALLKTRLDRKRMATRLSITSMRKKHMKYTNIIGTAAITLALGLAAPLVVAEMHGDKDEKHDKKSEHYEDEKTMEQSREANELRERTETGMGIEARPGSDGTDRTVPGEPDVGLDPGTEPGD